MNAIEMITEKQAIVLDILKEKPKCIKTICDESGVKFTSIESVVKLLHGREILTREKPKGAKRMLYAIADHIDWQGGSEITRQYKFVPYQPNQIPIEHDIPQEAITTHKLSDDQPQTDKNGRVIATATILQARLINNDRRNTRTEVMRNNSTLNRVI